MGEKLWCAMCGEWGDHRSGGCPEFKPGVCIVNKPRTACKVKGKLKLNGLCARVGVGPYYWCWNNSECKHQE